MKQKELDWLSESDQRIKATEEAYEKAKELDAIPLEELVRELNILNASFSLSKVDPMGNLEFVTQLKKEAKDIIDFCREGYLEKEREAYALMLKAPAKKMKSLVKGLLSDDLRESTEYVRKSREHFNFFCKKAHHMLNIHKEMMTYRN